MKPRHHINSRGKAWLALVCLLLLSLWPAAPVRAAEVTVTVDGISGELRDNALAYLSLAQRREDPNLTARAIRDLHEQAPEEIRQALQPFGYYQPEIDARLDQADDSAWVARYTVQTGPPVRIGELDVQLRGEGRDDRAFQSLLADPPLSQGARLVHTRYERLKDRLQSLAVERGYLDARFTESRIQVDLDTRTARVWLHFDTGSRYRFGGITFEQDVLSEQFLQRFVSFRPGQPFHTRHLQQLRTSLRESGYFQTIAVEPQRDQAADGRIPIRVRLDPRRPQKYVLGAGYGTDTGPRGVLGWDWRRVNEHGHRLSTRLALSQIRDSVTASYLVPLKHPATDRLSYTAGWSDDRTDTSRAETLALGIDRTWVRGSLERSVYLRFQQDDFTIGDDSDQSTLLLPGTTWTQVRADNRLDVRRGHRISVDLVGTDTTLGSSASFVQATIQGKLIRALGSEGRVLLRGSVGGTATSDFRDLPPSLRYFAGGDRSVRGYDYEALGPKDDEGEVIGGRYLMVASAEYEHHLQGRWYGAVFYDVGNALNDTSDPLEHGAGVGIRWRSPIGPIRADVASAISEPGDPLRLHISIGPDL